MRKIFTRLVSVGLVSFCMTSIIAQESKPTENVVERMVFSQQKEIELRTVNETEWWPDSVIYCDYLGKPTFKEYYDIKNRTVVYASLLDDDWVLGETYSSDGFDFVFSLKPYYRVNDEGEHLFFANSIFWGGASPLSSLFEAETRYDSNENLIFLEFSFSTMKMTYNISYNEKNNPVLLEYHSNNFLMRTNQYQYNENGHCTQIEVSEYDDDKKIMATNRIETMKYDGTGRPTEGNCIFLKDRTRSSSMHFYYSEDITTNEQIESLTPIAYVIDQTLCIRSEKTEYIAIYSIMGHKLYENIIQSGLTSISTVNFPQGVFIIKGSSGWTKKLIAK